MPFPFTFSLSAPGISNPFSAPPLPPKAVSCNPGYPAESSHSNANSNAKRRHPSPSPSQNDNSRGLKRGWEPSFAEPSQSMPTLASSNGYLDTPAKYREIAEQQKKGLGAGFNRDDFEQIEQNSTADEQQPPTKRRRGLAGSIVSTAVSAALIGTAVGLTVYRLWRDRGKDCVQPVITVEDASTPPPPPPYSSSDPQEPPTLNVVPATPRTARKSRNHQRSPVLSHAQSEEDQVDVDIDAVDDQMDWIGSKLSSLIEEGKKALGKQVVVDERGQGG
ncbi:hypothetical protein BT96DRAFT_934967 [Gymnopus androsaceus JB14]|uniref:Uncharacterized protein n=1 Tax=Gymnopus androsaceus JB14 TaxID=1447944 RepID=A0A6A4I8W1_9AGAR|nr:hypothetical protein BT96DRAFT_934967 [Gymnopus androsaceus JB14]